MEPEDLRYDVTIALDRMLGSSRGLEGRVLNAISQAPAAPGGRLARDGWTPPRRLAALVAVTLALTVMAGSVVLRAGARTQTPAPAGGPAAEVSLALGGFVSARSGWAVRDPLTAGQGPDTTATVLRTDDGGRTWREQLRVSTAWIDVQMRSSPDGRSAVVWAVHSTANPGGGQPSTVASLLVYRTDDAGAHWAAMPPRQGAQVASFATPDLGWALREDDDVLSRTTDGGRTWTTLGHPNLAPAGFGTRTLSFSDSDNGWFVTSGIFAPGHSGLFATHDGGLTWAEVALPAPPGATPEWTTLAYLAPTMLDDRSGLLVVDAGIFPPTDGRSASSAAPFVYATADGGRTWGQPRPLFPPGSAAASQQAAAQFLDDSRVQLLDADHWWIGTEVLVAPGRTDRRPVLFATADGGKTWTEHPQAAFVGDLRFVNALDGWAVEGDGGLSTRLLRTVDGGAHWIAVTPAGRAGR